LRRLASGVCSKTSSLLEPVHEDVNVGERAMILTTADPVTRVFVWSLG